MQRMSDDPVAACEQCGEPVQRVFLPVAVHFKGSGFYTTDYGRNRSGSGDSAGDSGKESKEAAAAKSDSGSGSSDSGSGSSDSGSAKSDSGSANAAESS
jgi:predicted nucleic acid-binding Zn ribbon protein